MKKNITVFNAGLAKKLIKMGYIVKDIKPNKNNPQKTVVFFDVTEEIKNIIKNDQAKKRAAQGGNICDEHKNITRSISSK